MSSLPTYVEPIHIVTVTLITGDSVDGALATPFGHGRRGGSMSVTSSPLTGPRSLKRPPKGRRRRRRTSKRSARTKRGRRHNSVPVSQRVDTLHTRNKSNDLPVHLQFLLTPVQRRKFENLIFREELTLAFLKYGEFIVRFDGLFVSVSRGDRTKQALKHLEKRLGVLWTRAMVTDVLKKIREDTAGAEGLIAAPTGASSSSVSSDPASSMEPVPELEKAKSFGDEELEVAEFLAKVSRIFDEGTPMVKHRRHKPSSEVWMKVSNTHCVLVSSKEGDPMTARTGLTLKRIRAVFDGAKAKQLFDSSDGRTLHTASAGGPRLSTVDPGVCLVVAGDRTTLRLQTETADTARFIKHSLRAIVKHAKMVLCPKSEERDGSDGSDADDEDDIEGGEREESLSKSGRFPDMLSSPMVAPVSETGTMTEVAFGSALAELSLYPSDIETDVDTSKMTGYDSSDKEELTHTFTERRSGTARGMIGAREMTESAGFSDSKMKSDKHGVSIQFWLTDKQLSIMETRDARSTLVVFANHFGQFRADYRMKEMEVVFESRRLHSKGVQILENRLGVLWEESEIKSMVRRFAQLQNQLPDRRILIEGDPLPEEDEEEGGQSSEEEGEIVEGKTRVEHSKSVKTMIELATGSDSRHRDTCKETSSEYFAFSIKRELIQYHAFFSSVIRQLEYGSRYYDYSARDGSVKQGLLYMRDMRLFHASTTVDRSSSAKVIDVDTTTIEEETAEDATGSVSVGATVGSPVSMSFPDTAVMHAPSLATGASSSVLSASVSAVAASSGVSTAVTSISDFQESVPDMFSSVSSTASVTSVNDTALSSLDLSEVLTMKEEKTCTLWDRVDSILAGQDRETPLRSRCFAVVGRDRTLLCEMESSRNAHLWFAALESLFHHVAMYGTIAGQP